MLLQADWERSRKELVKARHDVDRLRRAVDRSDVEKRDHLHQVTAVKQALQVSFNGDVRMLCCLLESQQACSGWHRRLGVMSQVEVANMLQTCLCTCSCGLLLCCWHAL